MTFGTPYDFRRKTGKYGRDMNWKEVSKTVHDVSPSSSSLD